MSIYSFIDEDKGGVEVGFETHSYKEDGTELDEEWNSRINDYVFNHQEQFPEFFEWLDKLVDEKIQKEAESMRKEGRSEDEVKGFTLIANSLLEDKNLEALEKLTLIYMIKYYNEKLGYAFPSLETLRKLLGYSHQRYVREKIESLICKGYITKETVKQKNRYYLTSKVLNIPKVQNVPKVQNIPIGKVQNVPNSEVPNVPTKNTNTILNKNNIYSASDYEYIWSLYPNKKGKAQAMKKIPKLLNQYGKETLVKVIERYTLEIKDKDKQYIKHGNTFFNGAYIDYLDENYQEDMKGTDKSQLTKEMIEDLYK